MNEPEQSEESVTRTDNIRMPEDRDNSTTKIAIPDRVLPPQPPLEEAKLGVDGTIIPTPVSADSIFKRLNMMGYDERFTYVNKLGEGGMANVYAIHDTNLDREVAVKILKETSGDISKDLKHFIAEASTIAKLEHPAVIPLYNLDVDRHGIPYLSMRKVRGSSLKEYIDLTSRGEPHPDIKSTNDLVQVFLKVCDALSFAHDKGLLHQDIKPENIMIGEYGEVFVIDWAPTVDETGQMSVTPGYMSPQQANGTPPTEADDIYCLGGTMFHCLILRLPIHIENTKELFRVKKEGSEITPLTREEEKKVPTPLLAILFKALRADPDERYESIAALARDLKNYQEGLAISAHRDSLWDFARRWYSQHRQAFWFTIALSLVLGTFGFFIYQLKLKEMASWGRPVFEEAFEWALKENWVPIEGVGEIQDGTLVSTSPQGMLVVYKKELVGSHAIEFDGSIPAGSPQGDLSVVWYQNRPWNDDGSPRRTESWNGLQVGAYANSFALISKSGRLIDFNSFRLEPGKVYRIRAELDGSLLKLFVDGKLLCSHRDVFPVNSYYIGLYGYYPGKTFDNIRIYSKGVPQKASITQVGDSYFLDGDFTKAENHFAKVLESHPDSELGEEALYKIGLCQLSRGEGDAAFQTWTKLKPDSFRSEVVQAHLQRMFDEDQHDKLLDLIRSEMSNVDLRRMLARIWNVFASALFDQGQDVSAYLACREELFPKEPLHHLLLARILLKENKLEEVLQRYPDVRFSCAEALLRLERYDELLEKYPEQHLFCAIALAVKGEYKEAKIRFPAFSVNAAQVALDSGHMDVLFNVFPEHRDLCARGLLREGKFEALVKDYPDQKEPAAKALLALGRADDVIAQYPDFKVEALLQKGLFSEALNEPSIRLEQRTKALLASGSFEALASSTSTYDPSHVEALCHLGRHQEALNLKGNATVTMLAAELSGLWAKLTKEAGASDQQIARRMFAQGEAESAQKKFAYSAAIASEAFLALGWYDTLITTYPFQREEGAKSLLLQNKPQDVLKLYPDVRNVCAEALQALGRSTEVETLFADQPKQAGFAACMNALEISKRPTELQRAQAELRKSIRKFPSYMSHELQAARLSTAILLGMDEFWKKECADIIQQHPHAGAGETKYFAQTLLGTPETQRTPTRFSTASRLLATALREGVQSDAGKKALEEYRALPRQNRLQHTFFEKLTAP